MSLGATADGQYGLAVELEITIPEDEQLVAEALVAGAHETCVYSRATQGNIDVILTTRVA